MGPVLRGRVEEEDIVQEAMTRLLLSVESGNHHVLQDANQFAALSYTILQNHLRDQRSHHGRQCRDAAVDVPLHDCSSELELGTPSTVTPSRTLARKERAEVVNAVVAGLAPLDREIVTRRVVDRDSFAAVGRRTNLSSDAVRKRFLRVLDKIRPALRSLVTGLVRRGSERHKS